MPRRSSFPLLWAILGVLGSAVVLINFFLPYIFVRSSSASTSQSLWDATLTSPAEIRCIFTGMMVLYWLAILLPMGAALSMLLGRGKQDSVLLKFSVVLVLLGFLMSLFFDLFTMLFAGFGMPSHGAPPSHSFGPDFWLAPIGFLLSLGSCSLFVIYQIKGSCPLLIPLANLGGREHTERK